ncbi:MULTISPECIES: class I SAM-dependent methyltransferase [unclassified Klebsiella]|uniref:class I SAM-dependent methyltransferase n=1 Tax=Enterobacteriaceae TaxID=543 RepID=UPI0015DBD803|nr:MULTISPECIES: class I SAM-dependent methyltransferase [unclassified Klebsiella]HAT3953353.1 methyltransferase domain-containing protein [Kluyvera ascorbata]BBR60769.1 SAM-dependent methyltransferase [Klebsiella sp. WP4-W18-ESBL-05]BBS93466.1 SAM-dependent methyltransferase [Klebsiella sp. WP7-S18-CRE-02]BBS98495.1 SAM-dependent methyltransferase [Klebsiella sp. WP7-S18-CRE-03]BBT03562.1 SAM-dependent methyltransferase [Klebsiella sp. WP7-S18-ESBL-04]
MTLEYYQHHADDFFSSTVNVDMDSLYTPFLERVPKGGWILDAGCGSGRDSKAFLQQGYQVEAFDATAEMAKLASQHTGFSVKQMTFSDVDAVNRYDGIWCCASLLHVSAAELPDAMAKLARALKPGGTWYVSFKYGDGERVKDGRHFTDLNEQRLNAMLAGLADITLAGHWITEDKRPDRSEMWLNALLQKRS